MARKHQRGFSLTEVLISGVLLGVGVMGVAKMFTHSSTGVRVSRHQSEATQLGLQRLESLAGLGVDAAPNCPASEGCRGDGGLAPPLPSLGTFDCTQNVVQTGFVDDQQDDAAGLYRVDVASLPHPDANQLAGSRLLRVSVCWSEDGANVQQVQFERLMVPEV